MPPIISLKVILLLAEVQAGLDNNKDVFWEGGEGGLGSFNTFKFMPGQQESTFFVRCRNLWVVATAITATKSRLIAALKFIEFSIARRLRNLYLRGSWYLFFFWFSSFFFWLVVWWCWFWIWNTATVIGYFSPVGLGTEKSYSNLTYWREFNIFVGQTENNYKNLLLKFFKFLWTKYYILYILGYGYLIPCLWYLKRVSMFRLTRKQNLPICCFLRRGGWLPSDILCHNSCGKTFSWAT